MSLLSLESIFALVSNPVVDTTIEKGVDRKGLITIVIKWY